MTEGNVLYYGDNLDVLRRHVRDESIDLVYLDPPFNSNADYNILFSEHGEKAAAQVKAFTDTWTWDTDARRDYEEIVEAGGRVADAMRAFYTMLGGSDMMAYLARMSLRLVELRRVLKPTGSLYLHCDPTAGAYLKLLLDAVFGPRHFRNEIVWHYRRWTGAARSFLKMHDTVFLYTKTDDYAFNRQFTAYTEASLHRKKNYHTRIKGADIYVTHVNEQGVGENDVWQIQLLNSQAKERLGYPTQKPVELLRKIILASSNEGDVVLDPFAGCGTTIDAAQELGRRWIGIDVTHLAVGLIKHRLADRYGREFGKTYRVVGEPTTVDGARELAQQDPFQFQAWALGLVGARIAGSDKKGGDKGIDGRLYFHEGSGDTKQIILSVKAGNLVPAYVDALWGVAEREKAEIGVLISFNEPTAGMRARAAEAGFYDSPWGKHPRLQLRTVGDLLAGKGIDYPHVTGSNVTLRRAQRARSVDAEPMELFGRAAEESADYGDSN